MGMDERRGMDGDLTPERLNQLVNAAMNPMVHYRRQICKRLVKQTYNQFGVEALMDMLSGIDEAGRFSSLVLMDRDEIDNFLFETYGIFDPDMFERVQMTEEWNEFLAKVVEMAGMKVGEIIEDIVREG